jgi:hypothetical protein
VINLEDSLLDRLALNPMAVQSIPFLKPLTDILRKQAQGCGSCNSSGHDVSHVRNLIKIGFMNTANTAMAVNLKKLLGTDQVRFFYNDGTGVKEGIL